MDTKLYHRDIFMPPKVINHRYDLGRVVVSPHARTKADERLIALFPDEYTKFCGEDVVEAEIVGDCVTKLVVRKRYSFAYDICYVIRYDFTRKASVLLTVWLNAVGDDHSTLDCSRYTGE